MSFQRLKIWIPAIIWMLGIFYLSSIPLKEGVPSTPQPPSPVFARPFLQIAPKKALPGSDTVQLAASSTFPLNEIFHFLEFGGLYFWIAFAFQRSKIRIIPQITKKEIIIALAISTFYLFFDETHQIFVPGRNFEFIDVILDILGMLMILAILKIVEYKLERTHN